MQQYLPWIVTAIAIAVPIALLAWRRLAQGLVAEPQALPIEWNLLPRPVFTADERRMYRQLREALPHHIVLAKLPLVRFCQPSGVEDVRYWYDLLGATHVTFAICSANGRVLAVIDLNYDSGGLPSRATRIKQSVMGACRVRYLRCAPEHMPSIPELQLLVPHTANSTRGPQAASAEDATRAGMATAAAAARPVASRRRERTALWQDSMAFSDSFFSPERGYDGASAGETPATARLTEGTISALAAEPPPDEAVDLPIDAAPPSALPR